MLGFGDVKTHILVANASEAKCYETKHLGQEMGLIKQYQHPESREKGTDLMSDGPGHYQFDGKSGHGAYSEARPQEVEAERFARELATALNSARKQHQYKQLIIIAPPHFHGLLNKHCSTEVQALTVYHVEKDYTKLTEKDLQNYLAELRKSDMH